MDSVVNMFKHSFPQDSVILKSFSPDRLKTLKYFIHKVLKPKSITKTVHSYTLYQELTGRCMYGTRPGALPKGEMIEMDTEAATLFGLNVLRQNQFKSFTQIITVN